MAASVRMTCQNGMCQIGLPMWQNCHFDMTEWQLPKWQTAKMAAAKMACHIGKKILQILKNRLLVEGPACPKFSVKLSVAGSVAGMAECY